MIKNWNNINTVFRISESKKVSVFDVKNKHPPPGAYKSPSYIVRWIY